MDHPEPKGAGSQGSGAGRPSGARAPTKGESSESDLPRPDQATPTNHPPTPPGSEPNTLVDDVTLDGSVRQGAARSRRVLGHHRLRPGELFGGRYKIRQVLGEGGMGTAYKAWDREVEHLVALKLIRPDLAEEPTVVARFKQELLTARQVTHRNVIRIYDLSEINGTKFITMEFVEGCDLRKLLQEKGKLTPEEAVAIMRQVCLAFEAAHGAGVIHRDLKPQNIMQESSGRILVMDFGLARSLVSDGMTQTGALLGTVDYMSPEQAMGKHLDARSDLFTLGLIFYELLTGNAPYKADTAVATLLKRNQERAMPASELDSSIPKGLSDIVGKCLERDLTARYQSVQEILADLDAWEGKRPVSASTAGAAPPETIVTQVGGRTTPWKWIAAGALLANTFVDRFACEFFLIEIAPYWVRPLGSQAGGRDSYRSCGNGCTAASERP